MTDYELKRMTTDWVAYHRDRANTDKWERWAAVNEHLGYLIDDEPWDAWAVIAAIHARDQSTAVNQSLCPGPLETLLAQHGLLLIDTIAAFARRNSGFAMLLRPLWRGRIDHEVWCRLQAIRERKVWRVPV